MPKIVHQWLSSTAVVSCSKLHRFLYSGRSRTCKQGRKGRTPPQKFSAPLQNFFILNFKMSNFSHSERHFCSLATYCTSKKTLILVANGGMAPPLDAPLSCMVCPSAFPPAGAGAVWGLCPRLPPEYCWTPLGDFCPQTISFPIPITAPTYLST